MNNLRGVTNWGMLFSGVCGVVVDGGLVVLGMAMVGFEWTMGQDGGYR